MQHIQLTLNETSKFLFLFNNPSHFEISVFQSSVMSCCFHSQIVFLRVTPPLKRRSQLGGNEKLKYILKEIIF